MLSDRFGVPPISSFTARPVSFTKEAACAHGAAPLPFKMVLAAWNAATYVGQVEDHRSDEKVLSGEFQECVTDVLDKYGKLWFTNEAFVVSRKGE